MGKATNKDINSELIYQKFNLFRATIRAFKN